MVKTFSRCFFALSFLFLFCVAANAYTLVMRGGHRIEIPNNFIVTPVGVTYEVASGISVTVQLRNVDIAATERANGEKEGSFWARLDRKPQTTTQPPQQPQTKTQPQATIKTVTNLDIETYAQAREKSEAEYEQKRVAMGWPSREEIQKRNQENLQRLQSDTQQQAQQEAQAESYWRGRATALRTEITALDAEMAYVRARINQEPVYTVFYTFVPPNNNANNGNGNNNVVAEPSRNTSATFNRSSQSNYGFRASASFGGGSAQGNFSFYYQSPSVSFWPNNGIDVYGAYNPFGFGFAPPFPVRYQSYNRGQLISRLQALEQARAGLLVRWQLLEEEARRAGVPPGWLR
jgi:hypothetical protein